MTTIVKNFFTFEKNSQKKDYNIIEFNSLTNYMP